MPIQTVWKSGNSLVVTIPVTLSRKLRIQDGSTVSMRITASGQLTLTPVLTRLGSIPRRKGPKFKALSNTK